MKNILFTVLAFAMVTACSSGNGDENTNDAENSKALEEEVMNIHDEVMPQMGELRKVEKMLRVKADSIAEIDSLGSVRHTAAADAISKANEDMMVWMRNFDPDFAGTEEQVEEYFEKQKEGIIKVRDDMQKSLEEGEKIINQ